MRASKTIVEGRAPGSNELNADLWGPMAQQTIPATKTGTNFERLLTPKEAAHFLRVSLSWLAKARMRGDGPPYIKLGRSIRYSETAVLQWMRAHQRLSTSQ
jgi:predicted DNA-binding transcriptional regulator AlpA